MYNPFGGAGGKFTPKFDGSKLEGSKFKSESKPKGEKYIPKFESKFSRIESFKSDSPITEKPIEGKYIKNEEKSEFVSKAAWVSSQIKEDEKPVGLVMNPVVKAVKEVEIKHIDFNDGIHKRVIKMNIKEYLKKLNPEKYDRSTPEYVKVPIIKPIEPKSNRIRLLFDVEETTEINTGIISELKEYNFQELLSLWMSYDLPNRLWDLVLEECKEGKIKYNELKELYQKLPWTKSEVNNLISQTKYLIEKSERNERIGKLDKNKNIDKIFYEMLIDRQMNLYKIL